MHKELQEFFDTHAAKAAETKAGLHAQLDTVLAVVHDAQAHVQDTRAKLRVALLAPHDHAIDPKLQYLRTRLAGLESSVARLLESAEETARVVVEVEQAFEPATLQIAGILERAATAATTEAAP